MIIPNKLENIGLATSIHAPSLHRSLYTLFQLQESNLQTYIKNLSSRVLALNLKRLSSDWRIRYGHPILLAETFVETPRLRQLLAIYTK